MRRLRPIFIMMLIFVFILTNSISPKIVSVSSATKIAGTEEDGLGISEYVGNGFQVAFKIENSWKDGYNAAVSIKNTGNKKIENWCLVFELSNEITNIWNAKIKKSKDSVYTIQNDVWNQDISVGNSVSFGFTAKGSIKELPDMFSLPGQKIEMDSGSYSVEYVITQDWIEGYNAQITINNNTAKVLEDWQIEFDFDNKISELWNAVVIDDTKKHYIIVNDTYNSHIAPHGSVSFGFHVDKGSSAVLPENISVYEHKTEIESDDAFVLLDGEIDEEKDTLTLYIDSVYESYACDIYLAWQSGETKLLATTEEQVYDIDLADMENSFSCFVTQKTDEGILKSNCLNIISKDDGFEIDIIDQDGDNLPDYFEEFIGTDSNNTDTDGDGLSDYYEYYELDTDPLDIDTDNNQTADGDEDSDLDGLTDLEEMNYGTDPHEKDTDNDGLSDFDEIHLYKTDPTDADTDADYMDDGDEINFNRNPLDEDSNQDGVEDGYEVYTVELGSDEIKNDGVIIPSLQIDMEGCYIPSLFVNEIDKSDEYLNDTIPGYIGSAYDFNVSEEIKDDLKATITYQFDKKLLDDNAFEPVIYYLNEETMELERVENQKVEGNSVVAQVTHFSIYVMLNSRKFDDVWNGSLLEAKAIELVLDGSASMEWNDRDNIRYHCADSLIDKTGKNDEIAVIGFDNKARVVQTFTSDKAMAQHAVRDTFTDGGTDICNAIKEGIKEFAKVDDTKGKYMILLTDGSSSTNGIDSLLSDAKAKKIRIFTIGLGKGVNTSLLKKIAEKTGGMYYFASVAEDLPDVFEKIEAGGITSGGSDSSAGTNRWVPSSALAYVVDEAGFVYEQYQDIIVSKLYPHQKEYGFTYGYDNLSTYLDMNIDCEPIYFFYHNKEYMVEFWKGQYGAETGGEIGVYYREIKALKNVEKKYGKWYEANYSDFWDMSFSLFQSPNKLFGRSQKHWWLTGFEWGRYVDSPGKLNMDAKFNFKDAELAQAFVNGYYGTSDKKLYDEARKKRNLNNYDHSDDGIYGLKARGYQSGDGYTINGKRVNVFFSKAKCKQPKKMVKRRRKVREHTKYAARAYRMVRCLANQTEEKKKHPNDPNNFDISCCKHLDKTKTKKYISAVYSEGMDVYNQFIDYVKKKNPVVAAKLKKAIQENDWSKLSDKDFSKISNLLCKYYDDSYRKIEETPSKLVGKVMELAEKVVKEVYQ